VIKSVAFIVCPIEDVARARKSYEDTLGLKLTQNFQNGWLEYDVG
jgi:catechol 2,3-dioxygenase-like lactoylglutathione lyase family enzyme